MVAMSSAASMQSSTLTMTASPDASASNGQAEAAKDAPQDLTTGSAPKKVSLRHAEEGMVDKIRHMHIPRPHLHHHVSHSHATGGDLLRHETELHLDRYLSQQDNKDTILVHWSGDDDPENPHNWAASRRAISAAIAASIVFNSTFSSSAASGIVKGLIAQFGFSREVATLTISMFVAGYMVGPLLWGPLSEFIGRKPVFTIALTLNTAFNLGCALAPNTASIIVFRFLAGCFAAASLSNSGGVVSDLYYARTRGIAMSLYAVAPFAGPALGPIVGGFIQASGTSWRWLFWVLTIFSGVMTLLVIFVLPETYAPILLRNKARALRRETGDERYKAPIELVKLTPSQLAVTILTKPFRLLFTEPMLLATATYMAITYGVLYMLFEAFPIVFEQGHGFNPGIGGVMFVPFTVGALAAVATYIVILYPRYIHAVDKSPNGKVPAEARLPMAMIGGPICVIGFFWFAWTSNPHISFWAPLMATPLMGYGFLFIFQSLLNYIVDSYTSNAASALAIAAIFRSALGAGFPLFATQMFNTLGTDWASTLLAFIFLLLCPIPFVLYRFGPKLRAMSKNAQQ